MYAESFGRVPQAPRARRKAQSGRRKSGAASRRRVRDRSANPSHRRPHPPGIKGDRPRRLRPLRKRLSRVPKPRRFPADSRFVAQLPTDWPITETKAPTGLGLGRGGSASQKIVLKKSADPRSRLSKPESPIPNTQYPIPNTQYPTPNTPHLTTNA